MAAGDNPLLPRIPIGISQCLLGDPVRYDGSHKLDTHLIHTFGKYFEFIPICPEVAIGMGVPRPPIQLELKHRQLRAVDVATGKNDVTDKLQRYGQQQARDMSYLCGYIFKSRSPSCGLHTVNVQTARGVKSNGRGIFAAALMEKLPMLPCEEESRLVDPVIRDNFVERVYVMHRWQLLVGSPLTKAALVEFHARHKDAVLAHSPRHYAKLGKIIAKVPTTGIRQYAQIYISELMTALQIPAQKFSGGDHIL